MSQSKNRKEKLYDGSSFNSFLDEEGIREEVEVTAIKRVLDGNWKGPCGNSERQSKWHGNLAL
jgi:hypothetical protein